MRHNLPEPVQKDGHGAETLSCRIRGFYPFPGEVPAGLFGWLFRDTHQAISVTTSAGNERLFMDFMTEGGQSHPVWYDDIVKWQVLFGVSIQGEVRIRGTGGLSGTKLHRLRCVAEDYTNEMNLYTSNCRVFCARMEREVVRLNAEDTTLALDARRRWAAEVAADGRLALAVLRAGALPLLYPGVVLAICWDGLKGL